MSRGGAFVSVVGFPLRVIVRRGKRNVSGRVAKSAGRVRAAARRVARVRVCACCGEDISERAESDVWCFLCTCSARRRASFKRVKR